MVALCLDQAMGVLVGIIQNADNDVDSQTSFHYKWEQYQQVRKLSDKINEAYNIVFTIIHINFILLLSYFVLALLEPEYMTFSWYLLGYEVMKTILIFYVATGISNKVKDFLITVTLDLSWFIQSSPVLEIAWLGSLLFRNSNMCIGTFYVFQNMYVVKWIKDYCARQTARGITFNGEYINILFLVDDIAQNPIGLGRGEKFWVMSSNGLNI